MFPSNKSSTCLFMMTISSTGKLRLLVASNAPWWRLEALTAPFCPFKLGAEKKGQTTKEESEGRTVPQIMECRWSTFVTNYKTAAVVIGDFKKKAFKILQPIDGLASTPLCFNGISERNNMPNQNSSVIFRCWHAWPIVRPLELAIFFSAHLPRAPRSTHNRGNVLWMSRDWYQEI